LYLQEKLIVMSNERQLYASRLWWDTKTPVQKEEAIELYATGDQKLKDVTSTDILNMWRCFLLRVASRVNEK
jgi:hypothetical protein